MSARRRRLPAADSGTVLLWLCGVTVVALLVVTTAVDATSLYLTRRSLLAAADAAALDAAQAVDETSLYRDGVGSSVPLRRADVQARVRAYVRESGLAGTFEGFTVTAVGTDGTTVVVRLTSTTRPPFRGLLGGAGRVSVVAEARARAPVR